MALTRNLLKSMSLGGEQIESIIAAHAETVEGLKGEIARYRQQAAALPEIQKELDEARQEILMLHEDPWEDKYRQISTEFDTFRQETTAKELRRAKEIAYRQLLREVGVSERRIDAVLRVTDLDCVQMEDNVIVNGEELRQAAQEEWAEFIGTTVTQGARTPMPPAMLQRKEDLGKLPMREYIRKRENR